MEILPSNNIIDNQRDTSIIQKKMENLVEEDDKKLMEVCKEFESVFIHMMLKEMKKTVPDEGIIEKSQATAIFEDMHLEELSKEMAKGDSGLGIAKVLYEQFKSGRVKL
ncbi:MAG: rod-binding protein [Tissierellaceae bacterium]|nr:rod-binding protein [Tissierellaceae bacterium]